jgi:hypothetical protein
MNMKYFAIDPGSFESGWLRFSLNPQALHGFDILEFGKELNSQLRKRVCAVPKDQRGTLVIEMLRAQGMPEKNETFLAAFEAGRFAQLWGSQWTFVFRGDAKMAICGSMRAKDTNIRAALIDLWGGEAEAIGGKKCPRCHGKKVTGKKQLLCKACDGSGWLVPAGPLYGMAADTWAALAVAVTWVRGGQATVQTLKPSRPASS